MGRPMGVLAVVLALSCAFRCDASSPTGDSEQQQQQQHHISELEPPCPLDWDANPCVCTGHSKARNIDCSPAENDQQVARVFQSLRPPLEFATFQLHASPLKSLPSDAFGTNSFTHFVITDSDLRTLPDDLFKSSRETLQSVFVSKTNLSSFPFQALNNFSRLETFTFSYNRLEATQTDSFGANGLPKLRELDLRGNGITRISPSSFSHLPYLEKLDLSENNLTRVDARSFSMVGQKDIVLLWLAQNRIHEIEKAAFENLTFSSIHLEENDLQLLGQETYEPLLEYMDRTDSIIYLDGNPLVCNSTIRWLVDKPRETRHHFRGFSCPDGTMLENLEAEHLTRKMTPKPS